MKMAQFKPKAAGLLLLGIASLSAPKSLLCQSKDSAAARLYIQVNVVPVLHSQPPAQPKNSSAIITFDLNSQTTQFDRQTSTHEVNLQTDSPTQPIVVTTVTLTPK